MNRTGNYMEDKGLNRLILLFAVVVAVCYSWQTALGQIDSVGEPSGSAGSAGAPQSSTGGVAGQESGSGIGGTIAGGVTNGFPDLFRRRLLFRFSLGQSYFAGITSKSYTNVDDFRTSASASVSYNWQRKRSDYGFDYNASAYKYNRVSGLAGPVRHSFEVRQTVPIGPRTKWGAGYRFLFTPDYGEELLTDGVRQQISFSNPLPRFGTVDPLVNPYNLPTAIDSIPSLNPLPDLGTPGGVFAGPPQGTIPFQSQRIAHTGHVQLSHALSARTNMSFGGTYSRMRFADDEYFGSDQAGFSASMGRLLTQRISFGVSYFGGRLETPGGFDLTWSHNARASIAYQLFPGIQVSIGYGPAWVRSTGQEAVPLSPVLANLLGMPVLFRDTSLSLFTLGWNGTTGITKQWERTQFGIGYSRGVSAMNALSSLSKSDSLALSLGRQIGQSGSISGAASYVRNNFIALQGIDRFDQASATLNLSRPITSAVDFSIFGNYSRLLTTSLLTDYKGAASFGVRLVFHFPRVTAQ